MSIRIRQLGWLCALAATVGCGYSRPLLGPQGTVAQQRYEASVHDPYTDDDLGPEVVGGRPRDFQKPLAEPVRSRWFENNWWGR